MISNWPKVFENKFNDEKFIQKFKIRREYLTDLEAKVDEKDQFITLLESQKEDKIHE